MTDATFDKVFAEVNKKFGENAIMWMNDAGHLNIEAIPTGSLALDLALGVGGIPRGRITEIYGMESSGKTTLCQHIIAEAQKMSLACAFIDMEHAMDPAYAQICGVDLSKLSITQPDTGEQALDTAEILIRSKLFGVVVIDSVAALVPRAELEGEMGDNQIGLQARLMSKAMRKLSGAAQSSNTALVFTNQLRMKIGVMFGNPEVTTGGNALKFYASVRMDIRSPQSGMIKDEGEGTGKRVKVTVKKNKVAIPYRTAEFDIMFGEGISKTGDVLDMAVAAQVVAKRGAFFSYGDTRLGQGRENSKLYLKEHPEMLDELNRLVREKARSGSVVAASVEETGEPEPEFA